jgi:glycosyltransferase involved in cell wall biosynthesis
VTVSGHSRMLKILHIDPERRWGGGEAQVLGLLSYLAERGHHNDLLTHPDGRLFQQSQALSVRTLPLVVRNDLDFRPIPKLRRLIRDENYDVIHFHTKRAHALSFWLSHGSPGPKYVVTRRMDYPESRSWYTRYLYNRKVDGVIAISGKIRELLIEAGVERERIRLIHSGIDPRPFETAANDRAVDCERIVVGMIAVLEERKGHRVLLEAARRLKARGCQIGYRLAGEGSLRKSLEETTIQLGLNEDVRFLDFVSDMPAFLKSVDIVVLPSLFEGLGVSVLEAMAAGKAVIASQAGGLADVVVDAVTGFLVAPGDAEALANAIVKLAGDRSLSREMGQKGKVRLKEHFTMEQMAKKNEGYYYALLDKNQDRWHGPETGSTLS